MNEFYEGFILWLTAFYYSWLVKLGINQRQNLLLLSDVNKVIAGRNAIIKRRQDIADEINRVHKAIVEKSKEGVTKLFYYNRDNEILTVVWEEFKSRGFIVRLPIDREEMKSAVRNAGFEAYRDYEINTRYQMIANYNCVIDWDEEPDEEEKPA